MSDICEPVIETIFSGRNNSFTLEYTLDGVLFDFKDTTKVEFILGGKSSDSATQPTWFDFSGDADGRIIFSLGAAGYVKADAGLATVIVYDTGNPAGAVFTSDRGPTIVNINVNEI